MDSANTTSRAWHLAVFGILLAALVFAIYAQTARHGFSVLDDDDYVAKNLRVQEGLTWRGFTWAMTTDAVANWHPLTWLSHQLDCQVFGLNAGAHHLVNVVWHALNCVLLFFVFRAMTGATGRSLVLAAVFAAHPLHVESVAWVSERKDVLSAFFWIATMGAYVHYARRPGLWRYVPVMALFALGLMAKPMIVTLPCVLLLLDYWPLRRLDALWKSRNELRTKEEPAARGNKKPGKAARNVPASRVGTPLSRLAAWLPIADKIPLFALSAASSVVTFIVQQRGGAMRTLQSMPLFQRIGNVFIAYMRYAAKAVWPSNLSVYYPHSGSETQWWAVAAAAVALAAVSALVCRGTRHRRYLGVGWLWFLGTLVPVIGLVQVGSQSIADRYMYLPVIGLFIIVIWGAYDVAAWLRPRVRWMHPALPLAVGGALAAVYAVCAFAQTTYWRDNISLFDHAYHATPNNDFVQYNLGIALKRANRNDEALEHFQEAIKLRNSYVAARIYVGLIHYEKGEYEAAIREYEQALQFAAGHPNHGDLENDLGVAYFALGKYEDAASHYTKAVAIQSEDPDSHYNLALTLQRVNRLEEALRHARDAVRINPHHERARSLADSLEKAVAAQRPAVVVPKLESAQEYFKQGNALADGKKYAEAAAYYQEAIKLQPELIDARINLGNALAVQGCLREAVDQFREAAKHQPDNSDVYLNLGHALTELGQLPPAAEAYEKAATLNPRSVEAWIGLGFSLARQDKPEAARSPLLKALALDPNNARVKEAMQNIDDYLSKKR